MILKAENLFYGAGGRELGRGLGFSLAPGEVLHLTGENGSGKSQLMKALLGYAPIDSGSVHLNCKGFRYLPQAQNRSSHLPYSLGEVLAFSGASNLLIEQSRLGLSWNKASGGERQRVLLSRFFSQTGELLLLDEPFNHLDSSAKEKVRNLLRETLESDPRAAAILISHDDQPASWLGKIPARELRLGGEA